MAFRSVTVVTTPTQLASYNARRKSLSVFNNSTTTTIFLSNDRANVVANGFPLVAQAAVSLVDIEGDEPELELVGQVSAGSADVRVQEGFPPEEGA